MLRFSKKDAEVILRDIPLNEFVPIILIVSVMIFLILFVRDDLSLIFPLLFAALGLLVVGIYKSGFIEIKTVKINKQKRLLSINNRSLVRNISHVYRFGEIADLVFVELLTDKNGGISHKLVFPLETGERIELARANSSTKNKYFEAANIVNHLVFDEPEKIPQNFIGFNKF